jgi:hypothetical protein
MRVLLRAAFVACSLGTTLAGSAIANHAAAAGCTSVAKQTESEAGGVGSVGAVTRKTESEGGGVGSVNAVTRKTEAEGGGVGSVNQPTAMSAADPCR